MMERTYGRRKTGIARTHSDSSMNDPSSQGSFRDYLSSSSSQEMEPVQDFLGAPFSSQDSSYLWQPPPLDPSSSHLTSFDKPQNGAARRTKKPRNSKIPSGPLVPLTSTLMEAQEFGEMMENVDEVNFALDGLRKGQQVRVRRASLSSLLSICGSSLQRRFLRTQGISKSIVDAILGLQLDDTPSNLAAATLFFVLTADGQDEHLVESPSCIQFLIKLLKPVIATRTEGKSRKIGSKLLSILKEADEARDTTRKEDSSSSDIISKVQEILVTCKEMKPISSHNSGTNRPELNPKWMALLTMEKACLSKVSFEETSGTVRKTGGNFKEQLREFGGLDAIFEVSMNCHSVLEGWMEHGSHFVRDRYGELNMQTAILLKCLKIMENAAFLSKDNQIHLLGMKRSLDYHGSRLSFTELMISVIKILSGIYLRSTSISADKKNVSSDCRNLINHASTLTSATNREVKGDEVITVSSTTCSRDSSQSVYEFDYSVSGSETSTASLHDLSIPKLRNDSSVSGCLSGPLMALNRGTSRSYNGSKAKFGLKGAPNCTKYKKASPLEDSEDPYAFLLEDIEPSKWEMLSGKQKIPRAKKSKERYPEIEEAYQRKMIINQHDSKIRFDSQEESSDGDHLYSQISYPNDADEECLNLLSDCLLTAVKVLMNLTNDNPIGCRQIAASRGLETMSQLIGTHFPLFSSSQSLFDEMEPKSLFAEPSHRNDKHLSDQELDFLVAILGLLVNLVEKDGLNRSRLAAASVSLPKLGDSEEHEQDMIPLLCSIFLANHKTVDTEEAGLFNLDDEEAVLESEKEAEKMIVEAYSALLLAFLSTESRSIRNAIADHLPKRSLAILVPVMERFVAFHMTLNMIPPETHKAVKEVIESCRAP